MILVLTVLVAAFLLHRNRSKNGIIVATIVLSIGYLMYKKSSNTEGYDGAPVDFDTSDEAEATAAQEENGVNPPTKLSSKDLQPGTTVDDTAWAGAAPTIKDKDGKAVSAVKANLLVMPSSLQGLVSRSSRNLDIRCAPLIKKQNVSPWMMSTMEPDNMRKGLDITECNVSQ